MRWIPCPHTHAWVTKSFGETAVASMQRGGTVGPVHSVLFLSAFPNLCANNLRFTKERPLLGDFPDTK